MRGVGDSIILKRVICRKMGKLSLYLLIGLCIPIGACQAQSVKMDSLLKEMTARIEDSGYPKIHSVLILRGNRLEYEHYFHGFGPDSLHDSRSSFKSITSLLMGIAIDKGFIRSVDEKVYSFFPDYAPFANFDERKKAMTIRDLLEMRSGFDCDEFSDIEKDCEAVMTTTKDWVRFSLDLPMKNSPGTVWAYTSCDPMIVSGIISHAAKMSIMAFAKRYLFDPLGVTSYRWTVDPAGHGMTAGSFYIRPADMLKIGRLVRDGGVWKGRRIVSEQWIRESTKTTIPIPDFSFVKYSKTSLAVPQQTYYGYYWYSEVIRTKGWQEKVLFASGNGGQYIMIVKDLDLVVVFTQGNYNSWVSKRAFEVLVRYVLPCFLQLRV